MTIYDFVFTQNIRSSPGRPYAVRQASTIQEHSCLIIGGTRFVINLHEGHSSFEGHYTPV